MLLARPLYDNRADARYFVRPSDWDRIVKAVDRGLNVLISGARGVGKTTLLRQLQATFRQKGERVSFVDAGTVESTRELASRARDSLWGPAAGTFVRTETPLRDPDPVARDSRALADLLRAIGEVDPTVVLVDASGSAGSVYGLFGRMRDTLWQQEHQWVVAIDEIDRPTALKPPADAFFDFVVALEPWSTKELVDLLGRRGQEDDPLPRALLIGAATGARGSAREALHALNSALVHGQDPATLLDERGRLLGEAAELGRGAGMLMGELLDRGQASPSDGDLQATLGVTRSRLTQMLRELLTRGLVVAESERPSGPGRPRTVYRPALPR
jgi:energy-coupling factor transporter ATP-binding protein EcfA2